MRFGPVFHRSGFSIGARNLDAVRRPEQEMFRRFSPPRAMAPGVEVRKYSEGESPGVGACRYRPDRQVDPVVLRNEDVGSCLGKLGERDPQPKPQESAGWDVARRESPLAVVYIPAAIRLAHLTEPRFE